MTGAAAPSGRARTACLLGIAALVLVGAAIRVNNAFVYRIHYGFDADRNWEYIEQLTRSWQLPAPDAGWSTGHPPLFYYASAVVARAFGGEKDASTIAVRLVSSLIGLLGIAAALRCIARAPPGDPRRWLLASGLLLLLPVHVSLSAMLGEEVLAASLVTVALVGAAATVAGPAPRRPSLRRAAALGLIAGLAFLTKLSAVLAIGAIGLTWLVAGARRRDFARTFAAVACFGAVAGAVGGWPYARNLVRYGYLYPQGLEIHREVMETMPPGARGLRDYLSVPWSTFLDPQAMDPDLLRSVWGLTYSSWWYDAHRAVLPRTQPAVRWVGAAMCTLALLPTAAFAVGLARGARRARASPGGVDTLLLVVVVATVAGYVLFTWRNPWYATVKGSYGLGLLLPFGWYTSEVLADWTRGPRLRRAAVQLALGALALLAAAVFAFGLVFEKREGPGFKWQKYYPLGIVRSAPSGEVAQPARGADGSQPQQLAQGAPAEVELHDPLSA